MQLHVRAMFGICDVFQKKVEHTEESRHSRLSKGQLLDQAAVVEGKHLAGNCDVEKAE